MKLLLDENLSRRLLEAIQDLFPGSVHVTQVGLGTSTIAKSGITLCRIALSFSLRTQTSLPLRMLSVRIFEFEKKTGSPSSSSEEHKIAAARRKAGKDFVSTFRIHLGPNFFAFAGAGLQPFFIGAAVLVCYWLMLLWLYRRKLFLSSLHGPASKPWQAVVHA